MRLLEEALEYEVKEVLEYEVKEVFRGIFYSSSSPPALYFRILFH